MLKNRSAWPLIIAVGLVVLAAKIVAENDNCTDVQQSNGPIITPCQSDIVLEKGQNFTIKCKGNTKLEFMQQEIPLEGNKVLIQQIILNKSSDTAYPFETLLNLYDVNEYSIGYYACFDDTVNRDEVLTDLIEEPNNTAHISYIYVYVNGTDSLFAPMTELVIPRGNVFMIECKPTVPDVDVNLNVDFPELYYQRYSPKIGFYLEDFSNIKPSEVSCEFVKRGIKTNKFIALGKHVKPPPKPEVIMNNKYFLENESFVLNCTVKYDRGVVINLHWNYSEIVPSETIIQDSNENDTIKFGQYLYRSLTVINATKSHAGQYTCTTKNSCGVETTSVEKLLLDKPFLNLSLAASYVMKDGYIKSRQPRQTIDIKQEAYPEVDSFYMLRDGKNFTIDGKRINLDYTSNSFIRFDIKNTTVRDSGDYTFVSQNKYLTKNFTIPYRRIASPNVSIGNDKKCLENTMVTFECKITAFPLPKVTWLFRNDEHEENIVSSTDLVEESCYELTARLTMPVQSGNISCIAETDHERTESAVRRLLVYEVPDGFGLKEEQDLWFSQEQDVAVKCFASIYDYKSVTWLDSDGTPLIDSLVQRMNSSYSYIAILKISQITLAHAGNYTCRAVTIDGLEKLQQIHIAVAPLRPPTVRIPPYSKTEEVYPKQQNIVLHCQADGVPPPQLKWEKDGVDLTNRTGINISTQYINRSVVNSTLKIDEMQEEFKGKYECVAFSDVEQRRSYTLVIKDGRADMRYLIVIIVIILFLILLVAYLTWKVKKMKQFKRELAAAGLLYFEEGATKSLNPDLAIDEQAELLPYDKKFEFPQEKLQLGKQLGAGAFGVVYKAEARGIINAEETTTVAVKMVKKNAETMYIKALASELKIMVHLGKHVNIVNLLGACTKNVGKRELIVIVEYCRFGNIHNYMQRHRDVFIDQLSDNKEKAHGKVNRGFSYSSAGSTGSHSDYFGSTNTQDTDHTFLNTGNTNRSARKVSEGYVQPEWRTNYESDYSFDGRNPRPLYSRDLLAWAFQIARGMEYLASRKILHGDLAARNVLLADDNIVKICDFGLAKSIYKNDEYQKKENSPLPIKWLALESMTDRIFSTQSDVWSFGIVLWELFSLAKTPYPNISPTSLVQWLSDGNRLEKPSYADDRLYGVMKNCWEQKPTARPSFTELQETLGTFLEDNVRNHYVDLNSAYMAKNVKAEGEQDYLEMVCAPDYNNLVTPSPHHYANTTSFFPTTPTQLDEDGYLQMNVSPQRIFSPRPIGATFDFDARKFGTRASEASNGSELTPMLALNRLPTRSGSESDQECPENNSPFANGCPRIEEESDDVFEKRNNEKNIHQAAVTNPTYITFDVDLKKPKDIVNNYVNIQIPNGIVE